MPEPIAYTWALAARQEKGSDGMVQAKQVLRWVFTAICMINASSAFTVSAQAQANIIAPASMPRVGSVDERFQSYNIEAVEITGGRFWKPYASVAGAQPAANTPPGANPELYEYRAPIDLSNPRLRKLAAALGPSYVRVSGTWMNSTYFDDSGTPVPAQPPSGFNSVLTGNEWKGLINFARAVDAKIVTSFAISAGTRDSAGVWTPKMAEKFLDYTKSQGGSIAAAEFMNEPTFPEAGGAPKGYDAQAYARDFAVFREWAKSNAPQMQILGPGGIFEETPMAPAFMHLLKSEEILRATGPVFDVFSYHSYGTVSSRCAASIAGMGTTPEVALSANWLSRSASSEVFYASLRDRYEPGKPIWNTETAQAACGGDRWAATFIDTFRYLNQLGSLARLGVQVQMHNTLNASDYGLLDEKTLEPHPDYWAALLWHKLMGTTVLDPGASPSPNLYLYAHCQLGQPGGVAVLLINADENARQSLHIPTAAARYTVTASDLNSPTVDLNGVRLDLGPADSLPDLKAVAASAGDISLAPASITFLAFPRAGNASCR
jgi:heparanase